MILRASSLRSIAASARASRTWACPASGRLLLAHQPKALRVAALLDKPSRRLQAFEADYVGFTIPDEFVVGYGMDFAEQYRNLPDICVLSPRPE